jgi:hypothetical protein
MKRLLRDFIAVAKERYDSWRSHHLVRPVHLMQGGFCAPRWLPRRAGATAIPVSKGWRSVEACDRDSRTKMPFV